MSSTKFLSFLSFVLPCCCLALSALVRIGINLFLRPVLPCCFHPLLICLVIGINLFLRPVPPCCCLALSALVPIGINLFLRPVRPCCGHSFSLPLPCFLFLHLIFPSQHGGEWVKVKVIHCCYSSM